MRPRLQFENIRLEPDATYDSVVVPADLTLARGELVWITLPAARARTPMADLAEGLLLPGSGIVRYDGVAWTERSPDDAASARGRIGRVFERGGWLSNLDTDENITLALRYHQGVAPEAAEARAATLARELGQEQLFRCRPALLPRAEGRRSQWIRAFLCEPDLLLLERPTIDVPTEWHTLLARTLRRALERGAAAIWISSQPDEARALSLTPSLHLHLDGEKLVAV